MAKSSQIPSGGYDPQLGSNYMLDGFDFDSEYGEGPESARKIPDPDLPRSNSGLAGLPDGFADTDMGEEISIRSLQATEDLNLSSFISDTVREAGWASRSNLQDFDWLEGAVQDPERLPSNVNLFDHYQNENGQTEISDVPGSGTREELGRAWGVDNRTDGQNLVPNTIYPSPPAPATSSLPGDTLREIVALAMRKSACGEDLGTVFSEVEGLLAEPLSRGFLDTEAGEKFASAMRAVRAEHGLAGNVYVRESAFPHLLSGKWDSVFRRKLASARYLLVSPKSKLASLDRVLGKQVVTSIPWKEAVDHYRPLLEVSGVRLASGDPKQALKAAFLGRVRSERKATNFPVHKAPEVSSKEAAEALSSASKSAPNPVTVVTATEKARKKARKKADYRIDRWVRAGLLTADRAREMRARISDPWDLYRKAAEEVAKAASKPYSGPSFEAHSGSRVASTESPLEVRKLLRWASQQMSEGAAGNDLDYLLNARFSREILKQAESPLVQLRKKHEGLSGHLYVDASSYASPEGSSGCEKGAFVHRANAIRAVLGMDRCGSCTANVEGTCQKYNKVIVASAPTKDPARFQKEMIRLANSPHSDAERTASLFAPQFQESEYQLRNDALDDIQYDTTPAPEDVGSILFSGWDLGDE